MDNVSIDDQPTVRPGDRWRQAVRDQELPQAIRDLDTEQANALTPERFKWRPELDTLEPPRPSRRRALEALPKGGSVIDVGVGGGASSLGLARKAGLIIGVDPLPDMLAAFEESGKAEGVATRTVLGAWPDVADQVEPADIVVCHNTLHGLVEIEEFIEALTTHARKRVVVELSVHPPQSHMNPLWTALHGIDRPVHYVADEAEVVLLAMGLPVEREDAWAPWNWVITPEVVALARKQLHVGPERDPEIEAFLIEKAPRQRGVVALWWPGTA